jgi:hypothetical protein
MRLAPFARPVISLLRRFGSKEEPTSMHHTTGFIGTGTGPN